MIDPIFIYINLILYLYDTGLYFFRVLFDCEFHISIRIFVLFIGYRDAAFETMYTSSLQNLAGECEGGYHQIDGDYHIYHVPDFTTETELQKWLKQ